MINSEHKKKINIEQNQANRKGNCGSVEFSRV